MSGLSFGIFGHFYNVLYLMIPLCVILLHCRSVLGQEGLMIIMGLQQKALGWFFLRGGVGEFDFTASCAL